MSNDIPPLSDSNSSFSDEMAQYLQVYIAESDEELEGLVGAILELEDDPRRADSLNKAFRMLHSLKGSSGMLGFEVAGNFAHELEDRFERYRNGQATLDRDTTTLVLKCIDYFRSFIDRLRAGDMSEGDPQPLLVQLQALEGRISGSQSLAVVASAPEQYVLPAMSMTGGLKIVVRFRSGLQLTDLKARLIVSRLSSIGEIVGCDPPIDEVHSFDELTLFSLTVLTDRRFEEVRKIASVDGVESVEIEGGEITAESLKFAVAQAITPVNSSPEFPPAASVVQPTPGVVLPAMNRGTTSPAHTSTVLETTEPIAVSAAEVPLVKVTTKPVMSADSESSDGKSQASDTLRVDIGRLDHLMNLTGELVISNARFAQISGEMTPLFRRGAVFKKSRDLSDRLKQRFEELRHSGEDLSQFETVWSRISQGLEEDLEELSRQAELWADGHRHFAGIADAVDQLTRLSKNLQRGVLSTRMVPVGPLFNRFKRVMRDLSVERGKQVQLVIQGEKTELDKRMIDALGDPQLHLVRNSIDHGLESAAKRVDSGKQASGTIVLEAAHRGNSVWITVRDDGAGLNVEKIRSRIVDRGLASPAQVQEMTEAQIISHIWQPGFSTAESVTEISGRGVGMDIVRNSISELSGTIDVASTPGVGTTFTIRLPLTLAIIHSLMVQYRDDCYSLPIDDVREIVSLSRSQVYRVQSYETIDVRGELIPLVGMNRIFHWASREQQVEPKPAASEMVNIVVIQSRGRTLGLAVDSLVGRADLVVKSLTENFQPVRGLSGASILGDGSVCLMLDSAALVELASERSTPG